MTTLADRLERGGGWAVGQPKGDLNWAVMLALKPTSRLNGATPADSAFPLDDLNDTERMTPDGWSLLSVVRRGGRYFVTLIQDRPMFPGRSPETVVPTTNGNATTLAVAWSAAAVRAAEYKEPVL